MRSDCSYGRIDKLFENIIMANENNQNTTIIEVHNKDLEKSVKTLARCAKVNTAITVGLTAAAVAMYAALGFAIKKMANM